ncbi:MAG: hypothetical protein EOL86_05125 [Deltaproteobacteria bacterium]|nr:hypothetical protein [Deltaproteobacteria bacterium]
MKFLWLFALAVFACGCATDPVEINLYGATYHEDAAVELSPLVEAVTPEIMPGDGLRALVLPFAVRQDVAVRKDVGRELGDIFRLAWLESRIFSALEYDPAQPWPGLDQALALAKARGANVLITGNVSQFFEGGGTGRTSIGATVEVHWVPTSTLIWSAAQAAMMEGQPDKDHVVVRTTRRLPDHPTYAVMRGLAVSMARSFARFVQE